MKTFIRSIINILGGPIIILGFFYVFICGAFKAGKELAMLLVIALGESK